MIRWLQRRYPLLIRGSVAKRILEQFEADVAYLHTGRHPTPRLRIAVRRYERADSLGLIPVRILAMFLSYVLFVANMTAFTSSMKGEGGRPLYLARRDFEANGHDLIGLLEQDPMRPIKVVGPYISISIFLCFVLYFCYMMLRTATGGRLALSWKSRVRHRYLLVNRARQVVRACALAKRHPDKWTGRSSGKRSVGIAVNSLAREVGRAYRREAAGAYRWPHRRKALKDHAGKVVAALRKAELRLDTDMPAAVSELSDLALIIADRYSRSMTGAMLDDHHLDGLEPVPDREPVRVAVIALVVAAAGAAIAFLELPSGAETYLTGGVGLALATLLYRGGATRATEIFEAVRGGPASP
ncbi:hypothetical protein [Streptomyces atratus]|uniref:hypothetical protein n=1 Tax=Streptomyces atratus TaxID=1893 RepID=UPI0036477559